MPDTKTADKPEVVEVSAIVPRYRLGSDAFFAPQLLKAGTVIDWAGEPGPHMVPLNDEAVARMRQYYVDKPGASLNPTEGLQMTVELQPALRVVEEAAVIQPVDIKSIADMAAGAEATNERPEYPAEKKPDVK